MLKSRVKLMLVGLALGLFSKVWLSDKNAFLGVVCGTIALVCTGLALGETER
jgi:hypothetical protein